MAQAIERKNSPINPLENVVEKGLFCEQTAGDVAYSPIISFVDHVD